MVVGVIGGTFIAIEVTAVLLGMVGIYQFRRGMAAESPVTGIVVRCLVSCPGIQFG